MIWGGYKGSPAYFRGTFSDDGDTMSGELVYPDGGGYQSTMTRVQVVSREDWLTVRKELLEQEKRARDALGIHSLGRMRDGGSVRCSDIL